MTIQDLESSQNFETTPGKVETIIKVIGVGGGGNNAISHMYTQNVKGVSFVNCNTDLQALNNSPVPTRLLLGPTVTHGNGAGNVPDVARLAAEESAEDIAALFDEQTKMVFITAGMGGGTGTGAAPVVARIAKEKQKLTVGIVTIPFFFEGKAKRLKALDGAEEMKKYTDALLVINNERLTEIYPDLDFLNAFHKADDTLTTAACSISEMVTCRGHINLDFNDVNTTLRNGGSAIISTGYGEGKNRVTKAIEDALKSPLLKDRDVMTSKRLLFNIYYNPNAEERFLMSEADELTAFVNNIENSVDVIWGLAFDESLGNQVKISILASGFDITVNDGKVNGEVEIFRGDKNKEAATGNAASSQTKKRDEEREIAAYGADKIGEMQRRADRQKYIVIPQDRLDDESILELIERYPAYARDKKVLEEIRAALASEPARTQEAQQPGEPPSMLPRQKINPDKPQAGNVISF